MRQTHESRAQLGAPKLRFVLQLLKTTAQLGPFQFTWLTCWNNLSGTGSRCCFDQLVKWHWWPRRRRPPCGETPTSCRLRRSPTSSKDQHCYHYTPPFHHRQLMLLSGLGSTNSWGCIHKLQPNGRTHQHPHHPACLTPSPASRMRTGRTSPVLFAATNPVESTMANSHARVRF